MKPKILSTKIDSAEKTLDSFFRKRRAKGRYNLATDWLGIKFEAKPAADILSSLKGHGFRWKPRRKEWIAKWTAEREDLIKRLTGKSLEKVNIPVNYSAKASRAGYLEKKHGEEAARRSKTFWGLMGAIPFGQPILVGHHSEKRHRAALRKMDRNLKKAVEEEEITRHYREKRERFEALAEHGEDPGVLYRRIQKLEAEVRSFESDMVLAGIQQKKPELAEKLGYSIDEVWTRRNLERARARLQVEREKYERSGGIAAERIDLKPGMKIRTTMGKAEILKVSRKSLRVKFLDTSAQFLNLERGYKIAIDKILGENNEKG